MPPVLKIRCRSASRGLQAHQECLQILGDGVYADLRVQDAINDGLAAMPPVGDGPGHLPMARDWRLRVSDRWPRSGQVQLVNPHGRVLARARVQAPARWQSAVAAVQVALVIFGSRIGVRPPGQHTGPYRDEDRFAELAGARQAGLVAWGITTWRSTGQRS